MTSGLPITETSGGFYNEDLGNSLDGTEVDFPGEGPTDLNPAPEPTLEHGRVILGGWLTNHEPPANGHWSSRKPIPLEWTLSTETAIVYEITVDPGTMLRLTGSFGVDNGIFIWVDGVYKFGAVEEGGLNADEYPNVDLGVVGEGSHFIQVLREDHGLSNGYNVSIVGSPPRDSPGVIQFSSSVYEAVEGQGTANVVITRSDGSLGRRSVDFFTQDGTADSASDYEADRHSVTFEDGDSAPKVIAIRLNDYAVPESDETVLLMIEASTDGAILGPRDRATLIIHDDDGVRRAGTLQFQTNTFETIEGQRQASVVVTRVGGSAGAVSAKFATSGGSATPRADYTTTLATVRFADGDTSPKTVLIPIIDDKIVEGDETVGLALRFPTGKATVGNPGGATLVIHDDDVATVPMLRFLKKEFRIRENGNQARITVVANHPNSSAITVQFRTVQLIDPPKHGFATHDVDYVSVDRLITIAPGKTSYELFVKILDDNITEGDEKFGLELRDPRTGALLAKSRVVIIDTRRPRPRGH